jgi:adenylyltransferase/sulfurtransferase
MDLSRQNLIIKNPKKLTNSKITIVGLGAIGSHTAELLTRSGIKNLVLIDRDYIEKPNLSSQHLFTEKDINKPKAEVIKKYLKQINPDINITSYFDNLDQTNINLINSDLVLDCTDNFQTRFIINDYCKKNKIPWIFSSAIRAQGYLYNILPNSPCFNCIFHNLSTQETCETSGILNTITSLISSIQVNEAIKILTKSNPENNLIYINLSSNIFTKIKVKKRKDCQTCNKIYPYLNQEPQKLIKLCGQNTYLIQHNLNFNKLKSKFKNITDWKTAFKYKEITVFKNKILIKANSEKQAKSIYSKYIGN